MTDYISIVGANPFRVRRVGRPSLSKISAEDKEHIKRDYKNATGVEVTSPRGQGLSQNHRVSDYDIQSNIISDINTDFVYGYTSNLIENIFPWKPNGDEKPKAQVFLKQLKESNDVNVKFRAANNLIELMSLHVANLSYGNSSQNSAIGQHLDLNAPKDRDNRHSLTPRSRHIGTQICNNPDAVLFTPPKTKNRFTIFSSQYGLGGKNNKEQKNIDILNSTPRTEYLLKKITLFDYHDAINYFKETFGKNYLDVIKKIPDNWVVFLHKNFSDIIEDQELTAEEFLQTPYSKLALMSNGSLLNLMRDGFCNWNDLASLTEIHLEVLSDEGDRIYEVLDAHDITFEQICDLDSDELVDFLQSDLEKAIFENGYDFDELVKLYRQDPMHLTCLTSDLYDLILDHAPDVPDLMLEYAEEFDIDLDEISDQLCETDRLFMSFNLGCH